MSEPTTIIRRARVTGLARRDAIGPLLRRLELARWPALDARRTVIIRELAIRGSSAVLQAVLAARLDALLAAALELRPGDRPPSDARAVAFASPALRLACLASDLASGAASDAWYWRAAGVDVRGAPAQAIVRAWTAEPEWLPEVVATLAGAEHLAPVWAALDAPAALELLAALARGARPFWAEPLREPRPAALQPAEASPRAGLDASPRTLWPYRLHRRWQPALLGIAADDPRLQLAAVLAALEAAPGCLAASDPAPFVAWQAGAPLAPDAPEPLSAVRASPTLAERASRPQPPARELPEALSAPLLEPTPAGAAQAGSSGLAAKRVALRGVVSPAAGGSGVPGAAPPAVPLATPHAAAVFLLNALAHPELLPLWQPQAPLHGWRWWRALCFDLGLPPDDPLAGALRDAVADAAELTDPPAPVLDTFRAAALATYAGCYARTLIQVPGTVRLGATHIDAWLPLACVRSDVRRAGLDLNPGWLPWLGRVVTIYFISGSGDPA